MAIDSYRFGLLALATLGLVGCAAKPYAGDPADDRCYVLAFQRERGDTAPQILGDTLILSSARIAAPWRQNDVDPRRAFLDLKEWREDRAVWPGSFFWTEKGDSIRAAYVLPMAGVIYEAKRTHERMSGVQNYFSDVPGFPDSSRKFKGREIRCPQR